MTDFEKKEVRALEVIAKKIVDLDKHLATIEESKGKVKHYIAQEEAIHDIRSITRHIAKIGKIEEQEVQKGLKIIASNDKEEVATVQKIDQEFEKLEGTLSKLADDDGKVKSALEQEKAIFEIKKILKEAGKLDDTGSAPSAS